MLFAWEKGYATSAVFLFILMWTVQNGLTLELNEDCVTPSGESGKCILFRECAPLVIIYMKDTNTPEESQLLMESRCGMLKRKPLVCCARSNNGSSSLPESPNCGTQLINRVIGGQPTAIDEFPWMALIEYKKRDGSFGYHCGGALINERYIVTAAHCVKFEKQKLRDWELHRVRLGEWNLTSAQDCQNNFCSNAPIDLDIEQVVVHSQYDTSNKTNDIALIRFTQNVRYTETVRPICLPLSRQLRERNHEGYLSYAAGWGKTETESASEIKLKVQLNVTSLQECRKIYERIQVFLKPTQMCAGGIRGKDTCSGDSGGPLMRQMAGAWHMIGIVSFGPGRCGTKGVPGIYTNIAEYVDWIEENVY